MADEKYENGNTSVTKVELMNILHEHNGQHHQLDLKVTRMCHRIEKLEEKINSAVQMAKWAIPLLLMLAAIIEHAVVSLITGMPQ